MDKLTEKEQVRICCEIAEKVYPLVERLLTRTREKHGPSVTISVGMEMSTTIIAAMLAELSQFREDEPGRGIETVLQMIVAKFNSMTQGHKLEMHHVPILNRPESLH